MGIIFNKNKNNYCLEQNEYKDMVNHVEDRMQELRAEVNPSYTFASGTVWSSANPIKMHTYVYGNISYSWNDDIMVHGT